MFAALANRPTPPATPLLERENAALLQRIARLEAIVEVLSEDQQTATAAELQVETVELRQRVRDHETQREVHVALLSKLQDQLHQLQEQATAEQARAKTEQVGYEAKVCALSWLVHRQQSLAHELRGQAEPSHLTLSPSLLPPSPADADLAEAQLAEALRCLSSCADSLAEHEASSPGAAAVAETVGACDAALPEPSTASGTAPGPPTNAAPTGQRRVASPLSRTPPPAGAVGRCSPVQRSSAQTSVAEAAAAADLAAEAAGAAAVTLAVMPTLSDTAAALACSLDALDAAMPLVRSGLSVAAVAGQPGPWAEGGGPRLPHEELQPKLTSLEQQTQELRHAIDAAGPLKELERSRAECEQLRLLLRQAKQQQRETNERYRAALAGARCREERQGATSAGGGASRATSVAATTVASQPSGVKRAAGRTPVGLSTTAARSRGTTAATATTSPRAPAACVEARPRSPQDATGPSAAAAQTVRHQPCGWIGAPSPLRQDRAALKNLWRTSESIFASEAEGTPVKVLLLSDTHVSDRARGVKGQQRQAWT